jgi:hypothetical protein
MLSNWQLPLRFDPVHLQADLGRIAPEEWEPHFNTSYYEGEWGGVALRAIRGAALSLYPDPSAPQEFADTAILDCCPYFQQVLAAFECPLESARLLRLRAGSKIREHRDYKLAFEDGVARFHVPIITNPDVDFFLEGERIVMNAGEVWYLNFNLPHRVENRGQIDRVHLVIDGAVNDWVRAMFPS